MYFVMKKSKIAFIFLSIINFQIMCMESDLNDDFELHRLDSVQSNSPKIQLKKKCSKFKTCQSITAVLNVALIVGLLVALNKVYHIGINLNERIDDVFPLINKMQTFLDQADGKCQSAINLCMQCIPKFR